ncbi:uncharacterized protein LOC133523261 isoform X2 [Cydia pomonella]|uniref:uncharacterized protein LOC133523261 isoform X2 n=1 Tax=Cydia pomonella TaxID=82600 RepID=UPI002ADE022E|nr:uncharacterized protein LOC133523261 isoform X2 [Cydia pomonella]
MGGGNEPAAPPPTTTTTTTTTPKPDWTLVWHFFFFDFDRPGGTIFIAGISIVHSLFHVPHLLLYRRLGILTAFWSLMGEGGVVRHLDLVLDRVLAGDADHHVHRADSVHMGHGLQAPACHLRHRGRDLLSVYVLLHHIRANGEEEDLLYDDGADDDDDAVPLVSHVHHA